MTLDGQPVKSFFGSTTETVDALFDVTDDKELGTKQLTELNQDINLRVISVLEFVHKQIIRCGLLKLLNTMLGLKKKFGKNAVLKGTNYLDGATMRERNQQMAIYSGHKIAPKKKKAEKPES